MDNAKTRLTTQKTETKKIRQSKPFKSNVESHPTITLRLFVMKYIDELQTEINKLSNENAHLRKENAYLHSEEYLDTIFPTNYIQELQHKIDVLETEEIHPRATCGSYTSSYVQELQKELTKITEENFYLKSEEYQTKILNHYAQEKILMKQKIKNLCLFILQFSHDSIEQEQILASLKQILDGNICTLD